MISYVPLPFRAGEVARGVVASTRSGIPAARVFSTIVVEKVLDILTLLLFLGISLPFVGLPKELQGPAILLGVGVLALTVVIMVLVLKPNLARTLIHVLAGRLPARLGPHRGGGRPGAARSRATLQPAYSGETRILVAGDVDLQHDCYLLDAARLQSW